jgi:hypothetical protein
MRIARLAGGMLLVLTLVVSALALLGALDEAWRHVLAGNVSLTQSRSEALDIAAQSRRKLWDNDPGLVVGLGAALVLAAFEAVRSGRRRPAFVLLTVTAWLLLVVLVLPFRLYAHLMAMPTVAIMAGALVAGAGPWRRLGMALLGLVLTVTTWQAWRRLPPAVHGSTAMQRATLTRVREALPRGEAVPYLWPSRCGAYVFNDDPAHEWMLTGQNVYDAAVPGGQEAFLRVFRDRVMRGEFRFIVGDPSMMAGVPEDIRSYLQAHFRAAPCLWERRP